MTTTPLTDLELSPTFTVIQAQSWLQEKAEQSLTVYRNPELDIDRLPSVENGVALIRVIF
jgi:hypothetical protein